jgi:hypothetical protein
MSSGECFQLLRKTVAPSKRREPTNDTASFLRRHEPSATPIWGTETRRVSVFFKCSKCKCSRNLCQRGWRFEIILGRGTQSWWGCGVGVGETVLPGSWLRYGELRMCVKVWPFPHVGSRNAMVVVVVVIVVVSAKQQPFYELLSLKLIKLCIVCDVHGFSLGQDGVSVCSNPGGA